MSFPRVSRAWTSRGPPTHRLRSVVPDKFAVLDHASVHRPVSGGRRHDTPVSDQVSDNGTEHSGISVPGPGRLATGKIIKRRPSEVLRDEVVKSINRIVAVGVPRTCAKRGTEFGDSGLPAVTALLLCNESSPSRRPALDVFQGDYATSILVALRPPAVASRLRSLTVASPQPVERSGDCAQVATVTRRAGMLSDCHPRKEDDHDTPGR